MRILIAAPAPRLREGGVANVVHNMAEALRERGHQVTCIFSEDVIPEHLAFPRFSHVYFAYRLAHELYRRRSEFDVVNIHAPTGFAYGLLRGFRRNSSLPPYVMYLHGIEERRNHAMVREDKKRRAQYFRWKNRVWQHFYHMRLFRWSIITADYSIVINRETWSMLQLKYNRETDRVWYIPNGVEPHFFSQRDYSQGLAERLLFVGTWIDHKGIYYLRESFEFLAQKFPGVRLTIAGCGVDAETVMRSFRPDLRHRVEVRPFVSRTDMPALYAEHDVFLLPSLMEGMPIVLLEAMATGMPVVTTETCGMMDLVEDEYNGLLVKPADSASFTAAVTRLMTSSELRCQVGQAAQQTARRHVWKIVAERLEHVFQLACQAAASSTLP